MTPNDPRHGTIAGHSAGCRHDCCRIAKLRYDKRRKWERDNDIHRRVPMWRVTRRLQALMCIGWSLPKLSAETGIQHQNLSNYLSGRYITVYADTFDAVDAAYRRLCMVTPPATNKSERIGVGRSKGRARRAGWAPPMAWDNIDDPDEYPKGTTARRGRSFGDVDPVIVERLAKGRTVANSTRAEKEAAMELWLSWGKSETSLCDIHGWRYGRYAKKQAAA